MKFLLPTAKEMAKTDSISPEPTSPQTQAIIDLMASKTPEELAALYKISPAACLKEHARWQNLAQQAANHYPAIALFNGLMYRQIDRQQTAYLSQHALITSALYGVIPADHPIAEHRLDFQPAVKIDGQSLKAYWRESFDQAIAQEENLISLLSSEFEEVFSPAVRKKLTSVSFHEEKDGKLKTHSTISKKGRGLLVNQASLENAQTIDDLKQLSFAGFSYRDDLSSPQKLVFVRKVD